MCFSEPSLDRIANAIRSILGPMSSWTGIVLPEGKTSKDIEKMSAEEIFSYSEILIADSGFWEINAMKLAEFEFWADRGPVRNFIGTKLQKAEHLKQTLA